MFRRLHAIHQNISYKIDSINKVAKLTTSYISQLNLPIFFVLSGYIYKLYSIYFLVINT